MYFPITTDAEPFTQLPQALHARGAPSEWERVTRPGMKLHSFLEGPEFDDAGNLWLVDVPNGRLFSISPDGEWRVAFSYAGEPHGLAWLGDGVFALTDYRQGVLRFDSKTSSLETLCRGVNSESFRGLGDIARAPDGALWFGDPGRSSLSDPTGRLFRLRPGHDKPDLVLNNVPYPNGIAIGGGGAYVYVAATRANAIWRLMAQWPDPVHPMVGLHIQLSGGLGPDGLAVTSGGLLAVAQAQAGRVHVFDALGDPVAKIHTRGGLWTTAVRFDAAGRWLYITEAEHGTIYRADMAGIPVGADAK
ncbi:SMP-30/gluconolactonase/LRE family protein [Chelatococcus sp.]|uniref:SMP-30/gluconolactonase/LRE family protein n=1 Tax=Chelatococcus sp. TaxID=1953771 RepID=UPI0025C65E6A|nr:SMP-30/gluconolactonase/LRE family protein [Chelatococcus sp.]